MLTLPSRPSITLSAGTNFIHLNASPSPSPRPYPRCNNWVAGPLVGYALRLPRTIIKCAASETERIAEMSNCQKKTTEILAELLNSENPQVVAQNHVNSFTEEFFSMSSAFMEMARKEGNKDMVKQIESALKVAMDEKGKTLRPEIQLLNQLLQQPNPSERSVTFKGFLHYLKSDSYFFELLRMMTTDVQMQMDSPQKVKILKQLENIKREADAISKTLVNSG